MDKAKKKRIKRYLTWVALACLVALLTVMPLIAKSEAEADGPVASILSATAEPGTITTALHGGGNLAAKNAQDVTIPAEVKITEFLVRNGQVVTAGTPLAYVDKVSVMTAITGVTETMEYLQEKLEDAREETVDATIYATAGGRVKKIFAKSGESVQEVMLRDACLAVLSIDGLMAVKIDNGVILTTGESVDVRFPDGTAQGTVVTGRVESSLNGVKVITVEDEGYAIGTEVTVSRKDGEAVGSGELYIHNAWKATAYSGTVSHIRTKEETTLSAGSTLLTLKDTDYTGEMQHRANQHREYEELLQKLLKMYESGILTAPCDGVISGVDEDSVHLLSGTEGEYTIRLLSNTEVLCTEDKDCTAALGKHEDGCPMKCTTKADCKATRHEETCITLCTKADSADKCGAKNHYSDCIYSCTNGNDQAACHGTLHHKLECQESCISSDGTKVCPAAKGYHKKSCIGRCQSASTANTCDADSFHHTDDCIESCVSSSGQNTPCSAGNHKDNCYFNGVTYKGYAVMVDSYGPVDGELKYLYNDMEFNGSSMKKIKEDALKALTAGLTFPNQNEENIGAGRDFVKNDILMFINGYKGEDWVYSSVESIRKATTPGTNFPGMGDLSGILGNLGGLGNLPGMLGGFSGYGNYSGMPQTNTENLYDLEGSTLMTVTPQAQMEITISLDEQDIAKVYVGMEAQVKIGALRGETFSAQVTKVGTSGANNGGSSKYAVTLTLNATDKMLAGMSATVQLPLESQQDVLTVPVAALTEDGAKTLVYTALDEKTGDPTNPVEIQTGASDGEKVEILSGLNSGTTVYYSYYDTLELDTSAEAERFTFG